MADEIKPKMVGGEAVCGGECCPHFDQWNRTDYHCTAANPQTDPCIVTDGESMCLPYYRARVAELEEALNRHAPHIDTIMRQERRIAELEAEVKWLKEMKTEREKWLSAALEETTARAEAAEAERDRLAAVVERISNLDNETLAIAAFDEYWRNHCCDSDDKPIVDHSGKWCDLAEWQRDEYRSMAKGIIDSICAALADSEPNNKETRNKP